jgi:hypothetical protein
MSETKPLLSFLGKSELKQKYVDRLQEHRRLEHLTQQVGWKGGKGCAIGCILEAYDHSLFPIELGLPEWLARLIDITFERLPKGDAEQFAEDVLQAIPVGVDIEPVRHKVAIRRLTRLLDTVPKSDQSYYQEVINAVQQVIQYHKAPDAESAESARRAAESAARSAESAKNAARSARRAAESAARSAESAKNAAWSAARSAESAKNAAWSAAAAYQEMAKDLIEELKAL